jgi:hypothetical protein
MRCGTRENEKEKSCEKSFLKLCRAIARSFQRKDDRDRQNDDENYDGQFVHVYKMKKSFPKKNDPTQKTVGRVNLNNPRL